MKEQIDKLVELAKEYADLHRKTSFEPERVYYRGRLWASNEISVNGNGEAFFVTFGDINITRNRIDFPLKATEKSLEVIYNDAKQFLESIDIKEFEKKKKEQVQERVNELKKELAELEGL